MHAVGVMIVVLMLVFIGIWIWAWLPHHATRFSSLARIPMEDDGVMVADDEETMS